MYWGPWPGFCIGKCIAGWLAACCFCFFFLFLSSDNKKLAPKSWTALFTNPFINRFREWAHFIYYLFREHLSAVWRGTLTEHVCAAAWLRYCSAGGVQRHASVSVCRWRWTVMRPRHQRGQGLRLGSCMAQILGVLQWHAGCRWGFFQSLIGKLMTGGILPS